MPAFNEVGTENHGNGSYGTEVPSEGLRAGAVWAVPEGARAPSRRARLPVAHVDASGLGGMRSTAKHSPDWEGPWLPGPPCLGIRSGSFLGLYGHSRAAVAWQVTDSGKWTTGGRTQIGRQVLASVFGISD